MPRLTPARKTTPARKAGTRLAYPGGMKSGAGLQDGVPTRRQSPIQVLTGPDS